MKSFLLFAVVLSTSVLAGCSIFNEKEVENEINSQTLNQWLKTDQDWCSDTFIGGLEHDLRICYEQNRRLYVEADDVLFSRLNVYRVHEENIMWLHDHIVTCQEEFDPIKTTHWKLCVDESWRTYLILKKSVSNRSVENN